MKYDLQKHIFFPKNCYEFGSIVRVRRAYFSKFNEKIAPNN